MKSNQKGFAVIEGLLIVIIIGMVVGVGHYVYSANKKTQENPTQTSQQSKAAAPKQITGEKVKFADGKASINLATDWKVISSESKPCNRSTGAPSDPAAPSVTCIAWLKLNPVAEAEKLAEKSLYIGQIMLVSSPVQSPEALIKAMISPLCGQEGIKTYEVTAKYEASSCKISGEFESIHYAARQGQNFIYLSVQTKLGSALTIETGVEKIIPAQDFTKYTPSFDFIAKSVQFE